MDKEFRKKIVSNWFKTLQNIICFEVEKLEKSSVKFVYTKWEKNKKRNEGGGEYRILKNGKIFEKVGVNFSEVKGKFSKEIAGKIPGTKRDRNFWASGISVVMHMKNPKIPAMHFNTRYIYTSFGWFGGGMDITPCIKDLNENNWFHRELKKTCDAHDKKYYKKYKKWCDKYFYLPHRKERRGIGGIFFDYKKNDWEKDFAFVRDVGITFKNIFKTIILKKYKKKWNIKQKELQLLKRGKYVEFNLIYDRGTKFGLQTGGNVDAILMSLPPIAKWK